MKSFSMILMSVCLVVGLSGCGKTLTELRANGDAVVDTGVNAGVGILTMTGEIVKKLVGVGFAVYDIGKKIVEDSKDNVGTVVNTVTGASATPAPSK